VINNITEFNRKEIGLLLCQTCNLWKPTLYLAIIDDLPSLTEPLTIHNVSKQLDLTNSTIISIISKLRNFINKIEVEMNLDNIWLMKPLIKGKELITLLNLTEGPYIKTIIQGQINWILENPEGSKDQCIQWLTQKYSGNHS